jgi:hypothetical protein
LNFQRVWLESSCNLKLINGEKMNTYSRKSASTHLIKALATCGIVIACSIANAKEIGVEPAIPKIASASTSTVLVPFDLNLFFAGVYTNNKSDGRIEITSSPDNPKIKYLRMTTFKPGEYSWQIGAYAKPKTPVNKGDVLWATLQIRAVDFPKEVGTANAEVVFTQKDAAGKVIQSVEQALKLKGEWVNVNVPFVVKAEQTDNTSVSIRFGSQVQTLEMTSFSLVNYGPGAKVSELPSGVSPVK